MSSARVIEIFYMPIKEGVEIDSTMRNLTAIGYDAPAGILSMYWGIQLEDPTTLDIIAGMPFSFPSFPSAPIEH
jgi:hypothetical protein